MPGSPRDRKCYHAVMSVRQELEARLRARPEVRFALLFGSRASGTARADSDWDVAVYLDEELDARARFQARLGLSAALEDLGAVDLVVLNDADALLGQRALMGERLCVKDQRDYVRYFVRTMALAEDQRYFDGILARAREQRLAEGRFGRR